MGALALTSSFLTSRGGDWDISVVGGGADEMMGGAEMDVSAVDLEGVKGAAMVFVVSGEDWEGLGRLARGEGAGEGAVWVVD